MVILCPRTPWKKLTKGDNMKRIQRRRVMVGLAGILSPIPRTPSREPTIFTSETRNKLEFVLAKMVELVSPLSSVSTRTELRRLLDRIAPEYLHLRNEVGRLTMAELSGDEFARFAAEAYDEFLKLVMANTAFLNDEDQEKLGDVIQSLRELLENALNTPAENQGTLTDILLECSHALQCVDMCLLSILLVLTGEIKHWNPIAIRHLTQDAQDHMRQVEDTFLIHDFELAERLRTRERPISLQEVRKRIGLPS